jgi:hypothetical protein
MDERVFPLKKKVSIHTSDCTLSRVHVRPDRISGGFPLKLASFPVTIKHFLHLISLIWRWQRRIFCCLRIVQCAKTKRLAWTFNANGKRLLLDQIKTSSNDKKTDMVKCPISRLQKPLPTAKPITHYTPFLLSCFSFRRIPYSCTTDSSCAAVANFLWFDCLWRA